MIHDKEHITNITPGIISAVGITVVDHIMIVDGFPVTEGSYHCDRYIVEGGGMAATALAAASKLGSSTRLFSRTGDDLNADFISEGLKCFGVDTSGIVRIPGAHSTTSFVLVDRNTGEKQFFSEWDKPAYTDYIEFDVTLLEGTSVLLLDGYWMEGALDAAKWAHRRGIPVVADFKRKYRNLETLFPFIDYFIIPSFFAKELVGAHSPERTLRMLSEIQAGIPVVTEGAKGGVCLYENTILRFRSFPVQCVDSTGAGDAFHGVFCHYLNRGAPFEHCLELASAAGALNCREFGGRLALPSQKELEILLREQGFNGIIP